MTDDSDLLARVARLEAIHDIERVSANYCRGADRRDLRLFLSVWASDAVWQVSDDQRFTGAAQIERGIRGQWEGVLRAFHWTSNSSIDLDGKHATAIRDVDAELQLLDGSWLAVAGEYTDSLVNVHGEWKITIRRARTFSERVILTDSKV